MVDSVARSSWSLLEQFQQTIDLKLTNLEVLFSEVVIFRNETDADAFYICVNTRMSLKRNPLVFLSKIC